MKPHQVFFPRDETKMGRPSHFDPDHYLDSVEQMICADELVNALKMLEMLPSYYRDNYPARAQEIKYKLYRQIMSIRDYIGDISEEQVHSEASHKTPLEDQWSIPHFHPRGRMMMDLVKEINASGDSAEIHEIGPANYWLPAALSKQGLRYSYQGYSLRPQEDKVKAVRAAERSKTIFCCFETIEHLWNPDDIYHLFVKTGCNPDYILLGCPKHTLYGGMSNWEDRELGHLKAWSPKDLYEFLQKHWPEYDYTLHDSHMMVFKGKRRGL